MVKKGKWSREEDDLLKKHIEKYGIGRSWQALAETLGLQRCGRGCRARWLNYLRPGLKHGNFTPAEESIICEMYSKRGSCWSVIAAQLPGRTDLAVKNYWNGTISKRFHWASSAAAARRRRSVHRPSSSTTSDATKPEELALVVHGEGSSTTGSSCYAGGFVDARVLAGSLPLVQAQPPLAAGGWKAAKEEVGETVPIERKPAVAPAPLPENAPALPGDEAGAVDMVCAPMTAIPLASMEPDDMPWIDGFDEIDSFLPWFDD
ncbi:transcription factor MYB87-like [Triticum urartu]|nr:transcription factor MYB87-like [Triticum urartu]